MQLQTKDMPPGLPELLQKTGQKPEDFVSYVAPYRPGDENIVLEGEDARRFTEQLKHNETCRGANAVPQCRPCARRNETLFHALDLHGDPEQRPKGDFNCRHCPSQRDSQARLDIHVQMQHVVSRDNF